MSVNAEIISLYQIIMLKKLYQHVNTENQGKYV